MRHFVATGIVLIAVLAANPSAVAKSPEWENAKVIKADFSGLETEAIAVPIPGGTAVGESSTSSGKHRRGLHWLKTEKYTYLIPNYCKANMVGIQWWLYLTLGGETKISVDSARTLHVIDDDGKDRKVHIIQRIANQPSTTPQQIGTETAK
jgi:hypothetical protein